MLEWCHWWLISASPLITMTMTDYEEDDVSTSRDCFDLLSLTLCDFKQRHWTALFLVSKVAKKYVRWWRTSLSSSAPFNEIHAAAAAAGESKKITWPRCWMSHTFLTQMQSACYSLSSKPSRLFYLPDLHQIFFSVLCLLWSMLQKGCRKRRRQELRRGIWARQREAKVHGGNEAQQ